MKRREQKAALAKKQKGMEEMIIAAFQTDVPQSAINIMCQRARITESRFDELRELANKA